MCPKLPRWEMEMFAAGSFVVQASCLRFFFLFEKQA